MPLRFLVHIWLQFKRILCQHKKKKKIILQQLLDLPKEMCKKFINGKEGEPKFTLEVKQLQFTAFTIDLNQN